MLLNKNITPLSDDSNVTSDANTEATDPIVETTKVVNGITPAPTGFPSDIPIEAGAILESNTTYYPDQNAEQLTLSYKSTKTVTQKYTEYKNYLTKAGYQITEGSSTSPVRAVFGTKPDVNLTVAVSSVDGRTLVQISYLIKSL